jgi:predicted aspartyl protease
MAAVYSLLTVSGPLGQYTAPALVDVDSVFTSIPAPALIEMGIEPVRVVRLRSAPGEVRFCQAGRALVTLEAQEEVMPVLFGEPGSQPLIGAQTLLTLLLRLDGDLGRLVPLH